MIRATIIGGAGYTAGELIRILIHHPQVELISVTSESQLGKPINTIHQDLIDSSLVFSGTADLSADVIFLCMGHGKSRAYLENLNLLPSTKIIDLSQDFRWNENKNIQDRTFVYGLPELNKSAIANSNSVANPGCFATAIQEALLPLANEGLLTNDVHITAITGSTGAGQGLSDTTHFSWRNNNASWYKPFTHQHMGEINESLHYFGNGVGDLFFIPNRGNFARGILATAYTELKGTLQEAHTIYQSFYQEATFTHITEQPIHLKQVVNTNHCHIHLHKHENVLLITSAIDNLLKGASGQAVQNMNLMFGFDEKEGLQLKASVF